MLFKSVKSVRTARIPAASHPVAWTALGAATLSLLAANVHADAVHVGENGVAEKVVNYADLDLSKSKGAAALYSRLRAASRIVCDGGGERILGLQRIYDTCFEKALSNAVTDVNHSNVTAMHVSDRRIRVAQRSPNGSSRSL